MSLQQILGISKRMGLQIYRSKWTIPYLILFPGFFIMIYWFGFSTSEIGTNRTYYIGVVNEDTGFPDELQTVFEREAIQNVLTNNNSGFISSIYFNNIIKNGFSFDFISVLKGVKYANNADSKNMFEIDVYNNKNRINEDIQNRKVDAVLELSPTFTLSVLSVYNHYWEVDNGITLDSYLQSIDSEVPNFADFDIETIELFGDQNYIYFNQAKTLLELFIGEYFNPGNYIEGIGGQINYQFIEDSEVSIPTYTTFEILLPGIIIFGIIIQPSLFAAFLCEEFRPGRKTFDRIKISPVSAKSYILGSLLIQIPIMVIQTLILFLFGILFGAHFAGNLILAYLLAISLLPFIAALSFIAAAYMDNEDTVGMIYGFGSPILGFASGAFTVLPKIVIFQDALSYPGGNKRDFLIWDLLPSTHISNAVRNVLLWDFKINDILPDLLMNLILSTGFLIISIHLFNFRRFRRRNN